MLGCVIQIEGWDPAANAAVTLCAASHDDPSVCHLNGQTWWPAIGKLPVLRYDLFDGAFGGQIVAPEAQVALRTESWPNFGRYALADARLRLWTGEVGAAWTNWTLRFDGRVSAQPKIADGAAEVAFAVDDRWLDQPLLPTYAGTTGAEGPAALKGAAKPLGLGAPRYVAGVLIDPVNSIFQVSHRAIQGVEAALERLARFGAPAGDSASYAALVAATVPPGRWRTCLAQGLVRFGAPPNGQVSFLVQGDAAGPNGWARKPGQLVRTIAQIAGATAKLDDASLNALDVARPYNLSIYLDSQTTARELVQQLAASVNAVAVVTWLGKLMLLPVGIGSPAMTLAADGSALPPVSDVQQIEVAAPFKRLAVQAERTWTVHPLGDVAFTATLVDMGAYAGGTTYREGNIVQDQGSSWLYTNPAPSAGNAPPTLPAESNSWWTVLAKAGANGSTPASVHLSASALIARVGSDGNYVAGQSMTFTAQRNATAATTTAWTLFDADGTVRRNGLAAEYPAAYPGLWVRNSDDSLTLTLAGIAYFLDTFGGTAGRITLRATSGGVFDEVAIQRLKDGTDGASALSGYLTNQTHNIAADQAGNAVTLAGAGGSFKVLVGAADVTAACTFSKVSETAGLSVSINATTGAYSVASMAAGLQSGQAVLRATYGGATIDLTFSVTKVNAAANGATPPDISLATTSFIGKIGADGNYVAGQAITFTAQRNATATAQTVWTVYDGAGSVVRNGVAAEYPAAYPGLWVRNSDDSLTLTLAGIAAFLDTYGGTNGRITVRASSTGVYDEASIQKVRDGSNGSPGADGYGLEVSVAGFEVACDYQGTVKAGALPLPFAIKVTRGDADVTNDAAISFTGSAGVTVGPGASDAGVAGRTLTGVGPGDGYLNVLVTIGGVTFPARRVPISKRLDPAPASNLQSSSRTFGLTCSSTTFSASNVSDIAAVITVGTSGALTASANGDYRAPTSPDTVRTITIAAKLQYRPTSGGSWLDMGAAADGSQATWRPNDGNDPGMILCTGSVSGLPAGANYEVRVITRIIQRSEGTLTTSIVGGSIVLALA